MPRRLKILVAEDDETDFMFLQCMLREAAVGSLFRVKDGEEAVNYLRGTAPFADRSVYPFPDVLLLDLKLPKISGHEILEWLQAQSGLGKLRICVLSGSNLESDRLQSLRAGADDYFVKPLSLGHIAALFARPAEIDAKSS